MFNTLNPMNRVIRAAARPVIGSPVVGRRLNQDAIQTSPVQQILGCAFGMVLAQTKNSWYLVLEPKMPQHPDGR